MHAYVITDFCDGMRDDIMDTLLSKNHDRRWPFASLRNASYYALVMC